MRRFIFLGPPGAGKGTQAARIAKHLGVPHISTGAMLRQAIQEGGPSGLEASKCIDQGLFVPDRVVLALLAERLAEPNAVSGFVLDGFPRNTEQAIALEALAKEGRIPGVIGDRAVDTVILLDVPEKEIVDRLAGRRGCPECHATFHVTAHPPLCADICDRCKTPLTRRTDDQPDTVSVRFKVYHEKTAPLIDYYEKRDQLTHVSCAGADVEMVTKKLYEHMGFDQEEAKC